MEDDSDDGEQLPGQSFFKKKLNENKENVYNEYENYDDNYEEQYYNDNGNKYCENNEDKYYGNYDDNNIYNYDNDNYNEYEEEFENYNNFDNVNQYNENNDYNNNYYYDDDNKNNYKDKYKNGNKYNSHHKYNNNNHYYLPKYKQVKSKEGYIASFEINFKLWLTLVIKMQYDKKKNICFSNDSNVNEEIIDSFLSNYNIEFYKIKSKEKSNLQINIEDVELKQTVGKYYDFEFFIIIKDKIEIFFVDKYIKIKVSGEICYDKYPKFSFVLQQYKLNLNYNKEKDNKNNIIKNFIPNNANDYIIEMGPEYSIKNEEFKKLYLETNGEKDGQNIKDLQKEILECLDNLMIMSKF